MKLSAGEIAMLRQVIVAAGADWKPAAQIAFRRLLLVRARQFLASGYVGSAAFDDHRPSVWPEAEFAALIRPFAPPEPACAPLLPYLAQFPRLEDREVESFMYWSKDRLGRKNSINVMHVTVVRSANPSLPEVFIIARQVFASHYLTGSFGITALTRATPGAARYLLYLHRSRVDVLDGVFAGFARHVIEHRIRAEAPASLQALRRRLEGGEPPVARHD